MSCFRYFNLPTDHLLFCGFIITRLISDNLRFLVSDICTLGAPKLNHDGTGLLANEKLDDRVVSALLETTLESETEGVQKLRRVPSQV